MESIKLKKNSNKNIYFILFFVIFSLLILICIISLLDIRTSVDLIRYFRWIELTKNESIIESLKIVYDQRGLQGLLQFNGFLLYKILFNFSKENWKIFFLFINVISFLLLMLSVVILFKKDFDERNKIVLLFPILLCSNFDYIDWSRFVMTDFIFTNLLFCLFVLFFSNKKNEIFFFSFLLCFFFIFFLRPTSIVFLIILINILVIKIFPKKKILSLFASYLIISFCWSCLLLYNDEFLSLDTKDRFNYYKNYFLDGVVVKDREHTYVEINENILDFLYLIFLRFINYFKYMDEMFSFRHNIYNLFAWSFLYITSFLAFKNFLKYDQRNKTIIISCLIIILSFTQLHSFLLIDFDWRYRTPILPFLCCISFIYLKNLRLSKKTIF